MALAFAELDDVAVDRRSTRPFDERSDDHEGHDDRDDERHDAESRAFRRCRSEQVLHVGKVAPDSTAGGCRSDPTQAAQELEHQEEDHPDQGSRQDEERGGGQDECSDDAGSASYGIGQRHTQDQREWHRDGEQSCHDSDQDAGPHAPVGPLDTRAPEIRQSGEPDAQQTGRDERHRRPRRGADDPWLTRSAGRRQEHPEAGDGHQARPERGFRDPFVVETGRVCGPAKHGKPEKDPGGVHAEDQRRLVDDLSRRRPQRQQPAEDGHGDGDRGEHRPIGRSTGRTRRAR